MMSSTFLDRTTPPHILTLVLATATNALAMNVFLPSLPAIARHFQADYSVVQLAVSLYLGATAVLQLFIGPASDRFGRRPVMLTCFSFFLVGSVATLYAPTIEMMLVARVMQAFSAAGVVLSRAIVRDTVSAANAASRMGYITMGMAVVPMIGPAIGGILDELYGWQAAFLLTLGFGCIAITFVFLDLGETNNARSSSLTEQFNRYPELFRSRRFWGYTLTAGFTSGTFFAFLGGAPFIASEMLGMRPSEYGLYFGLITLGYILGNFLTARFTGRLGINRMMSAGAFVSLSAVCICYVVLSSGHMSPPGFFSPMFLIGLGNGLTLPNANAGIVSVRPKLAGSAAGLGGALQVGCGATMSMIAGAMLGQDTGPWPLLEVMVVSSALAVLAGLYVIRVARQAGDI
ncbi:multidrug effflux MFS transporter [Mesorhizobium sp. CAU 1741]|uniref:multidrug effflux MFS transporter n=1 Tax=Mesorhizobium sp. CAU 1741 TaxID=3140366 RepID=UPI00325B18FD